MKRDGLDILDIIYYWIYYIIYYIYSILLDIIAPHILKYTCFKNLDTMLGNLLLLFFFKSKVLCILHVNMLIIIILEVLGSIVWSVNSNRIYILFLVSNKNGNVHSLAECLPCIRYCSILSSWAFKKDSYSLNEYFPCLLMKLFTVVPVLPWWAQVVSE